MRIRLAPAKPGRYGSRGSAPSASGYRTNSRRVWARSATIRRAAERRSDVRRTRDRERGRSFDRPIIDVRASTNSGILGVVAEKAEPPKSSIFSRTVRSSHPVFVLGNGPGGLSSRFSVRESVEGEVAHGSSSPRAPREDHSVSLDSAWCVRARSRNATVQLSVRPWSGGHRRDIRGFFRFRDARRHAGSC